MTNLMYEAKYEISPCAEILNDPSYIAEHGGGDGMIRGEMTIDAESRARAREWAEHQLEQEYPGDEGFSLLSLEVHPVDRRDVEYRREFGR